jgi:GTPase SAR1 family protein
VFALAANKSDLERSRQVRQEDAEAYAVSIGAALFATSAKLNKGVEQAFFDIATSARLALQPQPATLVPRLHAELAAKQKAAPSSSTTGAGARHRVGLVVLQGDRAPPDGKPKSQAGCCS